MLLISASPTRLFVPLLTLRLSPVGAGRVPRGRGVVQEGGGTRRVPAYLVGGLAYTGVIGMRISDGKSHGEAF